MQTDYPSILVEHAGHMSGPRNLFYANNSGTIVSLIGWAAIASQNVGDLLCRGGATTDVRCGQIHQVDTTKLVPGSGGYWSDHQWVVNFDASPGDSGAPLWSNPDSYFAYGSIRVPTLTPVHMVGILL